MAAGKVTIDTSINRKGFQKDSAAMQNDAGNFAKNMGQSISKGAATAGKALSGLKVLIATVLSATVLLGFVTQSVQAARQFNDAMTGMQSILEAQGRSFSDAKSFIDEYVSDGLVPATDAIAAYKNLASRGYSDDQIKAVMLALKDSAAYGRQAGRSMGEAIASATEGLKNENSLLVDNAGVTKNVAKMWEDYARSIGTTVANLTQQQKIQAEVNGILEETRFQTGDAARAAGTFSGQIMQLQFGFNNLKVAVGNTIIPIINAIMPAVNIAINALTKLFNVFAQVSAAIFGGSANQMSFLETANAGVASSANDAAAGEQAAGNATKQAAKEAKGALAHFDELNVLQKNTDSSGGGSVGGGSAGGGGGVSVTSAIDTTEATSGISDFASKILTALEPTIAAFSRLQVELVRLGQFAWAGLLDFYSLFLVPVGKWVLGKGLPRFIDAITNGLATINWENINSSLRTLWTALAPFAINVGSGLLWFFEKVLAPLGAWVMNKVVPIFIDILSSSIKTANGIINAFKPMVTFLWDNFLDPLADWTGGIVISVLSGINTALKAFSDWVNENESVIQGITITIGLFFLAWKATELMAFIQMSGGVIAALSAITAAISAGTIAKIADKFETIALTALFAKDFIVSIYTTISALVAQAAQWVITTGAKIADTVATWAAQAATLAVTAATWLFGGALAATVSALVAQAAQWIVTTAVKIADTVATWATTAATLAATAATWLFNAALAVLTSPITLIILAIGALIAIVILLIVNWDWVKEQAIAIWTAVKDFFIRVFTAIANFFTSVWTGISNFFINLWTNISSTISTIVSNIQNMFISAFTAVKDTVSGIFTALWNNIKGIINSILSGIQGLVDGVVGGVNSVIKTLNNLKFTVPDWIPGLGGKTFGFSIPELTAPQIPRLAAGAVIPPNHEFLAVLGDQKSGTNIEAPLETIMEAMRMVLAEGGGKDITIRFAGSLAELVRLLKPYIDKENSRMGGSLITKGAY